MSRARYEPQEHEQPKEDRRQDSLARLLELGSTCTAVMIYDGKLVVAANDISAQRGGNSALHRTIRSSLNFFGDCARAVLTPEASGGAAAAGASTAVAGAAGTAADLHTRSLKIMEDICNASCKPGKGSSPVLSTEQVRALIEPIIRSNEGQLKSYEEIQDAIDGCTTITLDKIYGRDGGREAGSYLHLISSLTRDFYKVMDEIQNSNSELSQALRSNYQIARDGVVGMHAEMRMLDYISFGQNSARAPGLSAISSAVSGAPGSSGGGGGGEASSAGAGVPSTAELPSTGRGRLKYIGISRLCCVDCYATVVALSGINPGLQDVREQASKLPVRGSHGIPFPWTQPEILLNPTLRQRYLYAKQAWHKNTSRRSMRPNLSDSSVPKSKGRSSRVPSTQAMAERMGAAATAVGYAATLMAMPPVEEDISVQAPVRTTVTAITERQRENARALIQEVRSLMQARSSALQGTGVAVPPSASTVGGAAGASSRFIGRGGVSVAARVGNPETPVAASAVGMVGASPLPGADQVGGV